MRGLQLGKDLRFLAINQLKFGKMRSLKYVLKLEMQFIQTKPVFLMFLSSHLEYAEIFDSPE